MSIRSTAQRLKASWYQRQLSRPEYTSMFAPATDKQWVAIDCEMTGLNAKKNHLLSVAAIHINGSVIDTAEGLHLICRPPVMPTKDTIIIHGLRPIDVEQGLSYEQMLASLLPFIGNRPIVGFFPQLDMSFLNPLVKAYMGTPLPNPVIDIRHLYNRYSGNRTQGVAHQAQQLTAICNELGIPELGAHDAYNDALMTAMAFLHLTP
ncbi:3'-5' exonuclease [Psychrobacter lutiphocae]|uniref:3'-5' exonuclease n=1 Tax=Psychrobacter lutiphocae TaxID=540500 RepID=UPI0003621B34|nr:3'-5' exonuclease [Psychrobacter lutiphocae]